MAIGNKEIEVTLLDLPSSIFAFFIFNELKRHERASLARCNKAFLRTAYPAALEEWRLQTKSLSQWLMSYTVEEVCAMNMLRRMDFDDFKKSRCRFYGNLKDKYEGQLDDDHGPNRGSYGYDNDYNELPAGRRFTGISTSDELVRLCQEAVIRHVTSPSPLEFHSDGNEERRARILTLTPQDIHIWDGVVERSWRNPRKLHIIFKYRAVEGRENSFGGGWYYQSDETLEPDSVLSFLLE